MNKRLIAQATLAALALSSGSVFAAPVAIPNNIEPNTPARAEAVQENFAVVENAVNDSNDEIIDNANAIGVNATNIGSNASAIGDNTSNIMQNAGDISTNAADIDTNETAISDLQSDVSDLQNATPSCGDDMVQVGTFCIDKYEASLHTAATGGTLIPIANCDITGANCVQVPGGAANPNAIFAQSLSDTAPSIANWFQALQACANVGKRLPTNAEWQTAAVGSNAILANELAGDGTDCRINGSFPADFRAPDNAGATNNCTSAYGVVDMIGNAGEWVADWVQGQGDTGTARPGEDSENSATFGGDSVDNVTPADNNGVSTDGDLTNANEEENVLPAAIFRGGQANEGAQAGEFSVGFNASPSFIGNGSTIGLGFRCAKDL